MEYLADLKGKKVLIMGLGLYREGSGISAAKFFIGKGAQVTVTDLKTKDELKSQLGEIKEFCRKSRIPNPESRIRYVLGRHRLEDFKRADIVVQNPGVRRGSEYLVAAEKAGAKTVSDISVFLSLAPTNNIIGVTGTRGKSTTTAIIHKMLKSMDAHAEMGGNILRSPFVFLNKLHEDTPVVLELSSWQCESLERIKKSPYIAVFTNLMRDHLNTYKGMADYAVAKSLVYKYQSPEDIVILNRDNEWTRKLGKNVSSRRFWFSLRPFAGENGIFVKNGKIIFRLDGAEEAVAEVSDVAMTGAHNLQNALAAVCAVRLSGVGSAAIRKVLKNFKGLPNRMEEVREVKGVKFINDTTATTPDATIAALKSLGKGKNVILIFGGADKKLEYGSAAPVVKKFAKAVVLLPGTAEAKIKKALRGARIYPAASMKEAVKTAVKLAGRGDCILLSPGAASFGLFKNEFDRGEQFIEAVKRVGRIDIL